MRQKWHRYVQNSIFALLLMNTCLLAAVALPPFFGYPALFGQRDTPLLAMDLPAQQEAGGLFGNIRLETEQKLTLPQALVFINGRQAGDLGTGSLLLRVYEGDVLSIDATAYQLRLQLHISTVSSNIDSVTLPPLIITEGNIITLPPIRFK